MKLPIRVVKPEWDDFETMWDGFVIKDADDCVVADDGSACGEYRKTMSTETARRIVACVNACDGLPESSLKPGIIMAQAVQAQELIAQRDELLAALEKAFPELDKIDRHCLGWPFVSEPVEILRAAIARAKGGAE